MNLSNPSASSICFVCVSFSNKERNYYEKILETLEEKANDLGISPAELIRDYDDIKNILSVAESVDSEFRSAYKELLRQANERFGLADFS